MISFHLTDHSTSAECRAHRNPPVSSSQGGPRHSRSEAEGTACTAAATGPRQVRPFSQRNVGHGRTPSTHGSFPRISFSISLFVPSPSPICFFLKGRQSLHTRAYIKGRRASRRPARTATGGCSCSARHRPGSGPASDSPNAGGCSLIRKLRAGDFRFQGAAWHLCSDSTRASDLPGVQSGGRS